MMLQILESGQALYALAAVCVLGILARLTARTLYRRLIRETDNMALTKNRYLREFKQKAENTYRLNQGIHNTQAYLEKQLTAYRFLGITLNGWTNLAGQMTVLCFLLGGAGSFLSYWYRCDSYYIVLYASAGILMGLLTLFLDIGVNLSEKRLQLLCVMQDYLENSLFNRLARETAAAMDRGVQDDPSVGSVQTGPRAVSRGVRDNRSDGRDGDSAAREVGGVGIRGSIRSIARGRAADGDGSGADGEEREESLRLAERNSEIARGARRSERVGRKSQTKVPEGEAGAERGRLAPDELRRSLEQIAASREKSRSDSGWLKELSSDELELVGEILQQYLE